MIDISEVKLGTNWLDDAKFEMDKMSTLQDLYQAAEGMPQVLP